MASKRALARHTPAFPPIPPPFSPFFPVSPRFSPFSPIFPHFPPFPPFFPFFRGPKKTWRLRGGRLPRPASPPPLDPRPPPSSAQATPWRDPSPLDPLPLRSNLPENQSSGNLFSFGPILSSRAFGAPIAGFFGHSIAPLVSVLPPIADTMSQRPINTFFGTPVQPCPRAKPDDVTNTTLYFCFQDSLIAKKARGIQSCTKSMLHTFFEHSKLNSVRAIIQPAKQRPGGTPPPWTPSPYALIHLRIRVLGTFFRWANSFLPRLWRTYSRVLWSLHRSTGIISSPYCRHHVPASHKYIL